MPSKSKQQQKFMGIVRAIQKGDEPASKFSKDAQDAADDMKKKDVEKFASTKHKGLPKKVEQALREKIRTMVEDYVESCGYVVSAKDPNYKLKSPGGTGEEDRELKDEGFGGELPKTEKKKFEKERLENAEVLGYTLTGTKDLKEKKESVFAVRQDKIKNGERFSKKPNFDYDPEKGKSRIKKVSEAMNPSAVKKMRDEFEKTGQLPPHLKKFALDLKILKKKHKVKNIVVPGLEWMSDMKEQSVNEKSVNENRDFEKLYKLFTKKDYFNLKNSIKTMLRNWETALKKGDKGAQKYKKQDIIKAVTIQNKANAKRVYDELVTAIKKKDIRRLKSRLRYNQPYSIAIFNQTTGKKLPKNTRDIQSFLDNEFMKESVNEASVSQVRSTLSRVKKQLMKKWAKKGGYENFGQKELRALKSKFKENPYGSPQERQISKMLDAFDNWAMNYSGDMSESINEARLDPKQTIQQLGGNRFLYMVGAKNLAIDKPRNELHMKIMRNAKGVSHVVVRLTSLDLYDMKFLSIRAGKIRVKAKEKGVYGDQLATFFKKHTGLNTRL